MAEERIAEPKILTEVHRPIINTPERIGMMVDIALHQDAIERLYLRIDEHDRLVDDLNATATFVMTRQPNG